MNGTFVTFEGIEACGKSTQLALFGEWLQQSGHAVEITREPGGTSLGEKIRELLRVGTRDDGVSARAELLLFEASRAQHVEEKILPALALGAIVLCDRFYDSTTVYQGAARKLNSDIIRKLNGFASYGLVPNLTILLDISVDESFRRIQIRATGKDRIEQEGHGFFTTVREQYKKLAENDERFFVVDGSDNMEIIHEKIKHEFSKRFF